MHQIYLILLLQNIQHQEMGKVELVSMLAKYNLGELVHAPALTLGVNLDFESNGHIQANQNKWEAGIKRIRAVKIISVSSKHFPHSLYITILLNIDIINKMKSNIKLLRTIEKYVKEKTQNEVTGHNWFHADRVRNNSIYIAKKEFKKDEVNLFILQAIALMHDLGDWKINNTKRSEEQILKEACMTFKPPQDSKEIIINTITQLSFNANIEHRNELSVEGKIVQDADRLDALGAIGIARAFAFGGQRNRQIYNPSIKPQTLRSIKDYKNTQNPSINHFYEKLFLLNI